VPALEEGSGCAVVSSTSALEQEQAGQAGEMRGCQVRQHDNIGSIITMLIADQVSRICCNVLHFND
jgi:hypothetical protein